MLSRSDVVKMLGKFLVEQGHPIPNNYNSVARFTDIAKSNDLELKRYAAVVFDAGVFKGDNGNLMPYDEMTRENIALVLSRLVSFVADIDADEFVRAQNTTSDIKDINRAKPEARTAIKTIEYFGLTIVDNYRPKESTNRGQFASFIYRLLLNVLENEGVLSEIEAYKRGQIFNVDNLIVGVGGETLSGSKALPNTKITILDDTGKKIGEATADSNGNFNIELSTPVEQNDKLTVVIEYDGKRYEVPYTVGVVPVDPDVPATTEEINALKAELAKVSYVATSTDGRDIWPTDMWTTATEKKLLEDQVAASKAVADKENPTKQEIAAATKALEDAIAAYNAVKKPGIRVNTGGGGGTPPPAVEYATEAEIDALEAMLLTVQYVAVSTNGQDISMNDLWTTAAEKQAMEEQFAKSDAIADKTRPTKAEVVETVKALQDAIAAYNAAKKPGVKVDADVDLIAQTVKGKATSYADGTVEIYIEGELVASGRIDSDGIFELIFNRVIEPGEILEYVFTGADGTSGVRPTPTPIPPYPAQLSPEDVQRLKDILGAWQSGFVATSPDGSDIPSAQQWTTPAAKDAFIESIADALEKLQDTPITPIKAADIISSMYDAKLDYDAQKKPGSKEAHDAVIKAEQERTQATIDAAQALVNQLPAGTTKDGLQARLDALQDAIEAERLAEEAVAKAETDKTQEAVDDARELVNALPDGPKKDALTDRLDNVQNAIDSASFTLPIVEANGPLKDGAMSITGTAVEGATVYAYKNGVEIGNSASGTLRNMLSVLPNTAAYSIALSEPLEEGDIITLIQKKSPLVDSAPLTMVVQMLDSDGDGFSV